ncbi:MAG: hypothetical protein ACI81T_004616 [Bacteroidia bacterium]|jgi:hypothetical protein
MKSKLLFPFFIAFASLFFASCDDEEPTSPILGTPATYTFERNGTSTVSFDGQTTRIEMATELTKGMLDFGNTKTDLLNMFRNENSPFPDADLNTSSKSVKSKIAASEDYFSANTVAKTAIQADFETWISNQADDVFLNEDSLAMPGKAGQLADGGSTRYVSAKGLEYNQAVAKGIIGGLMVDQILNNYLSTSVLDLGTNIADNDAGTVVDGKSYTSMEHKWDESFGYAYGKAKDITNPDFGDDAFLLKYIGRAEGDEDFKGIADAILNAFIVGRKAIVDNNYVLRDAQAEILRKKISEIIGIRAVYYLKQGAKALPDNRASYSLYGPAFHDLSEGYGFIYSLQFTRKPNSSEPYFTKTEVDAMISDLMGDGTNGLWDAETATLDAMATKIAAKFDFTVEQAAE